MTTHTTRSQANTADNHNSRTSLIGSGRWSKPIGIKLFGLCFRFDTLRNKRTYHKALVLFLTYIAYAAFHMGRRPLSIVKNVLNRNCSALHTNQQVDDFGNTPTGYIYIDLDTTPDTSCDWAPFDDDNTANRLLAVLDTAFLASYAISMFFSGMIAERTNLRYFVTFGSILSGLGLIAFGSAYGLEIHSMTYFIVIQIMSGAAQSIGWPVVVTCINNWFEPDKLGTIYGIWNSHTNLGNILGATIAGFFVEKDWGLSFIVPGGIMIAVGLILFLFLVPMPQDVELESIPRVESSPELKQHRSIEYMDAREDIETSVAKPSQAEFNSVGSGEEKAVSFLTALKIPGVIEYSLCLFFSKLVSYTFLYWLPRYITSSTTNNSEHSAYLSVPFDLGGIVGAILAGYISDISKANGITCNVMLLLAIPSMFAYQKLGALSTLNNITLQLLAGTLVNGPYCLITTAVSADLSNRVKDGKAMATVSAIIDGMGSVGAVLGPLFAGFVSNSGDWESVFLMLIVSNVLAALCLSRITISEIKTKLNVV